MKKVLVGTVNIQAHIKHSCIHTYISVEGAASATKCSQLVLLYG